MSISEEISVVCEAFVNGLKRILGAKLYGVYIYGAAAFPDAAPTADIDFHVILNIELSKSERSELEMFHRFLAERYPPLGCGMDGYYILLKDARRKSLPQSQMWTRAIDTAWALHREHILAGKYIILYGPHPKEIYPPATWAEIEIALYKELDYVEKNLYKYPDYCILNLCRLIYSFETGDVAVSKAQTAKWACTALPEWKHHIDLAKKSYAHQATAKDKQFMLDEVESFFQFAKKRIECAGYKTC